MNTNLLMYMWKVYTFIYYNEFKLKIFCASLFEIEWPTKILIQLKMCDYHDIRYRNIKKPSAIYFKESTNFLQNIQVCCAVSHIV